MTGVLKRIMSVAAALSVVSLSACGAQSESVSVSDIILNADEVEYNTVEAEIGSIGESYHTQADFLNPYVEYVYIKQNGVVGQIFVGDEISEGELICEEIVDDISEELEKQKVIADAAEETYNSLLASGVGGTELEKAQINYELEKNKYDRLLAESEQSRIYAPCSGKIDVDSDNVYAGAAVEEGQFLCRIYDDSQTCLCAFVRSAELEGVEFGSKVIVTQEQIVNVEGTVIDIKYVDQGSDYSGYYYVIDVPEDTPFVEFAQIHVEFNINRKDNVVVVPLRALKQVEDRKYVNVLIDGVKVEIDVETGLMSDDEVEILSGLSGGEKIVVN